MSTPCEHVWEPGPLGYEQRCGQKVVHQRCSQCGAERWAPVAEPEPAATADEKICPMRSRMEDQRCIRERCAWWTCNTSNVSQYHCAIQAIATRLTAVSDAVSFAGIHARG